MKWRTRIGFCVVLAMALLRMAFSAPALPAAHADYGTPTPTPTPANGQCNEFQCG